MEEEKKGGWRRKGREDGGEIEGGGGGGVDGRTGVGGKDLWECRGREERRGEGSGGNRQRVEDVVGLVVEEGEKRGEERRGDGGWNGEVLRQKAGG